MKTVTINKFLTDAQIQECMDLYPDRDAILKNVIEPNMDEINRKLGQENDARYISYMVIYVLSEVSRKGMS